jgi:transcriptional regulator with XRE-family HTH domain
MNKINKIKDLRKLMNMSQKELCSLLNIKQCTLSNYETGNRHISIKVCYKLIRIAKLKSIHLTIEELRPE